MILCVNANAAIDKTLVVEGFHPNGLFRPSQSISLPGGKGCNVARVLQTLGEATLLTGWVGGHSGRFIEAQLAEENLPSAFVQVEGESRTCLTILDPLSGTVTEIYEKGEPLPANAQEELIERYNSLLPGSSLVVISGSLPPGVPAHLYADLISRASRAGIPAFLDSSGEALRIGLEQGRPDLIKPNRVEFEALIGKKLETLEQAAAAVRRVAYETSVTVVVSLGAEGALMGGEEELWLALPPPVKKVGSAVGSGDALLAGLAYGRVHDLGPEETLRLSVACGAANTLQTGAGNLLKTDINRLAPQVKIKQL